MVSLQLLYKYKHENKRMKKILYILLLCFAVASCSDSSDSGSITPTYLGLFVENFSETTSTKFSTSNVGSVSISSYPDGWEVSVSNSTNTLTVTSPAEDDAEAELTGSVVLSATTPDDTTVYKILTVGKVDFIALDDPTNDVQANSMVITQQNAFYTFNPYRRGESEDIVSTKVSDCELTWTTSGNAIKYVRMMDDGKIGFYIHYDEYDVDEDEDETDIIEANAVISALMSDGTIMWSWHLWITESEVSEVVLNGVTFMDRNIGAFTNLNTTIGDTYYTDNIFTSYGLYYQWGRKDPFLYPSTYNASANYTKSTVDGDGDYLSFEYYDSTSTKGRVSYTIKYPRYFLTATSSSNYDWMYSGGDATLWGAGGEKTIYDPSPKGWRVPSIEELNTLTVATGATGEMEDYGAELSGELFMALGRRVYLDASIQNYAPGDKFTPWAGYYWSRDVAADGAAGERNGAALYFYLDQDTQEVTLVSGGAADYRSTGMQIRPVKM